ncbi:MAG TPA: esterase-like activity of phytase family protein [Novosphingobium sp.]|nr:esterase-like activity of phytase family protein [Novosphingobium sp.]
MSHTLSSAAVGTALQYVDELLAKLDLPGGQLLVLRGVGSGLTRRIDDPEGIFWAVGDRGPNLKVKIAVDNLGLKHLAQHADLGGSKIMLCPDIGPAISQLRLDGDKVVLVRSFPLRDQNGRPLSGLPTPGSAVALAEPAFGLDGSRIPGDPSGADTEGIAACPDGTFFVGDEYGPSLLHIDAQGRVLVRWVPAGLEPLFARADYPVVGVLPAIASLRRLNRGFEGLVLSPDARSLYLAFQSPLAHPDESAHRKAEHVRLWQLDTANGEVTAQYLYPLDPPSSFRRDTERGEFTRADVKVSELAMIGPDRLLVLERGSATSKLYAVRLCPSCAVGAEHLDIATTPTIEELSSLGELENRLPVLQKSLVMSTDDLQELDADLEGMILLSPRTLLLVNDNDFGVEGIRTRFWRIDLSADL